MTTLLRLPGWCGLCGQQRRSIRLCGALLLVVIVFVKLLVRSLVGIVRGAVQHVVSHHPPRWLILAGPRVIELGHGFIVLVKLISVVRDEWVLRYG